MHPLIPYVNKRVKTPMGEGKLWQVFDERVGVVLDSNPKKVYFFKTQKEIKAIKPIKEVKK